MECTFDGRANLENEYRVMNFSEKSIKAAILSM